MRIDIPTSIVDNDYEVFPVGKYNGTISGAKVRDPNGDGSWVIAKVSVTDVTPREGTAEPARNAFSGDITLRNTDKDGNVVDVRDLDRITDKTPFPVRRAAGLLAGLGTAAGVADRTDGRVSVDLGQVAEALVNEQFNNQRIGFEVTHYLKDGKPRDQFTVIGPAND